MHKYHKYMEDGSICQCLLQVFFFGPNYQGI